jgi:hypothetical protein
MLYASPLSFALIGALATLPGPAALRTAVAVGLTAISLIPAWPIRGRLYFQVYVPPTANRLVHLYPVASELAGSATFSPDCVIAGDGVTHFFMATHLGLRAYIPLRNPDDLYERWAGSPSLDLVDGPAGPAPVCAAVLLRPEQVPLSPGSSIARASRHWRERSSNPRAYARPDFVAAFRKRVGEAGWRPVGAASWINPRTSGLTTPRQLGPEPKR